VRPAPFGSRLLTVAAVRRIGAYTLLSVADPEGDAQAGQFTMLAAAREWGGGVDERPYLGRATSLCTRRGEHSDYLLEDVGPGTARLCALTAGEQVRAVGPLGQGFKAPDGDSRAVLVGGGIGVAPLVLLAEQLPAATVLLGFRDRERTAAAALFAAPSVASDDGSVGHHGSVVELLERELAGPPATVYACGPPAMLEVVRARCTELQRPCQLALEAPMACGFGACWGCVVERADGGYLRVCVDGPVLDAGAIAHVPAEGGAA